MKLRDGVDLLSGATDGYFGDWENRPALNPPRRFDHQNPRKKQARRRQGFNGGPMGRKGKRGIG